MSTFHFLHFTKTLGHICLFIVGPWTSWTKISPKIQLGLAVALVSVLSPGTIWAAECPEIASPLVNHFKFESQLGGAALDEIGAQNISVQNTDNVAGIVGNAVRVNSNSSLSLGNYSPAVANGLTISAWIKPTEDSSVEARLLSKASGTSGNDHQLMVGSYLSTALRFRLRTNNRTSTLISSTGYLAPEQWSFVTFIYDLQSMKIYHDGVMIAQVAKTGPVTLGSSVPMAIGNQPAGSGDRPFNGLIDDLRIFDGALSDTEVATLMAHRRGDCGELLIEAPVNLSATTSDTEAFTDTGLIPDTTYSYSVTAEDFAGNLSLPAEATITTEATPPVVVSDRDQFWGDQGYTRAWFATPDASEISEDGEAYLRAAKWSNGVPLRSYNVINNAAVTVRYAPDGTPAVRLSLGAAPASGNDNRPSALIWGHQLGNEVADKKIVYSQEVWYPCATAGQQLAAQYISIGPHWGSDASLVVPGGSFRPDPNSGWTFRVPVATSVSNGVSSGSGLYYLYTYLPDQPGPQGSSFQVLAEPQCGQWDLVELEIIPNRPASAFNAIVRIFINKVLITTRTGLRIRELDDVHARGFGMFMSRGNQPVPSEVFQKNQQIFTGNY